MEKVVIKMKKSKLKCFKDWEDFLDFSIDMMINNPTKVLSIFHC